MFGKLSPVVMLIALALVAAGLRLAAGPAPLARPGSLYAAAKVGAGAEGAGPPVQMAAREPR
ncbi:MAG: hypothetical protein JWO72_667 [Caulobacteraceae bacterium]|nr:hypothetical protein [Caulobacteraceae bacterium]